ncbi:hypothetical protein G4B88_027656 [Cannabis sativa]|uniref:Uncharacterized protein n=1 Tax=Cannabis sativa TaxID=3483 RepID=A0A7J6G2G8_CANSA|nr:hypothetical protein G4B88_027656 [Cannabis sativa]
MEIDSKIIGVAAFYRLQQLFQTGEAPTELTACLPLRIALSLPLFLSCFLLNLTLTSLSPNQRIPNLLKYDGHCFGFVGFVEVKWYAVSGTPGSKLMISFEMDRDWMSANRLTVKYREGVDFFLEFSAKNADNPDLELQGLVSPRRKN